MEQMTGIEPAWSAWEAEVLPLNYICVLREDKDHHYSHYYTTLTLKMQEDKDIFRKIFSKVFYTKKKIRPFCAFGKTDGDFHKIQFFAGTG